MKLCGLIGLSYVYHNEVVVFDLVKICTIITDALKIPIMTFITVSNAIS